MSTSIKSDRLTVRSATATDADAIIRICHQTGYMGEPVGARFKDQRLFAYLFALSYLEYEHGACFVAELDQEVIGYCVCVADSDAYSLWFKTEFKRQIKKRVLTQTLWRSPGDVLTLLRWSAGPAKEAKEPGPDMQEYSAHLHINVMPGYQRVGIGSALMAAALADLSAKGVRGLHLKMSSKNVSAARFYAKLGFAELYSSSDSLWREPGVRSICLGLRNLPPLC